MQEISDIKEFYIWYQISQKYNTPPYKYQRNSLDPHSGLRTWTLKSSAWYTRAVPDCWEQQVYLLHVNMLGQVQPREGKLLDQVPIAMERQSWGWSPDLQLNAFVPSSMPLLFQRLNSHKKPWILTSWMLDLEVSLDIRDLENLLDPQEQSDL